jgi:hypothetical protein
LRREAAKNTYYQQLAEQVKEMNEKFTSIPHSTVDS